MIMNRKNRLKIWSQGKIHTEPAVVFDIEGLEGQDRPVLKLDLKCVRKLSDGFDDLNHNLAESSSFKY